MGRRGVQGFLRQPQVVWIYVGSFHRDLDLVGAGCSPCAGAQGEVFDALFRAAFQTEGPTSGRFKPLARSGLESTPYKARDPALAIAQGQLLFGIIGHKLGYDCGGLVEWSRGIEFEARAAQLGMFQSDGAAQAKQRSQLDSRRLARNRLSTAREQPEPRGIAIAHGSNRLQCRKDELTVPQNGGKRAVLVRRCFRIAIVETENRRRLAPLESCSKQVTRRVRSGRKRRHLHHGVTGLDQSRAQRLCKRRCLAQEQPAPG